MTPQHFAETILGRYPLTIAVPACGIGGLRDQDWMPVRFRVKDLVMEAHDPKAFAKLSPDEITVLPNGSKIRWVKDAVEHAYQSAGSF